MDEGDVIGGWPVHELAQLAEVIAWRQRGLLLDHEEAADVALCALVDACLIAPRDVAVSKAALFRAGHLAIANANQAEVKHVGLSYPADRQRGDGVRPRYLAYWYVDPYASGFEESVVDAIAVHQVWSALPVRHQRALDALVTTGTHTRAAAHMDVGLSTWLTRIARARYEARRLWHAPETPSHHWAKEQLGRSRLRRAS